MYTYDVHVGAFNRNYLIVAALAGEIIPIYKYNGAFAFAQMRQNVLQGHRSVGIKKPKLSGIVMSHDACVKTVKITLWFFLHEKHAKSCKMYFDSAEFTFSQY